MKALFVFGLSLLLFGSSALLARNYELRQGLASLLCDFNFRATFEARRAAGGPELTSEIMKKTKSVLLRRLDPDACGCVRIKIADGHRLHVDQNVYGARTGEALIHLVTTRGITEFRILPVLGDKNPTEPQVLKYRDELTRLGPTRGNDDEYLWKRVRSAQDFQVPESITGEFGQDTYVLASNQHNETLLYSYDEDAWAIQDAHVTIDSLGYGAVDFSFDEAGASKFFMLTKSNSGRPMAILVDDEVITAPRIETAVSRSGQITGRFAWAEVYDLAHMLDVPPLPVELQASYDSND